MLIKVDYASEYHQFFKDILNERPDLDEEIDLRIKWFRRKPTDERLKNHRLTGVLNGLWSFSITGDIRILYEWKGKNKVRFLAIGGHGKVYGRDVYVPTWNVP